MVCGRAYRVRSARAVGGLRESAAESISGSPDRTPLWYYVLREAECYGIERDKKDGESGLGGRHLGPLGSQIVAETIIGILWRDSREGVELPR